MKMETDERTWEQLYPNGVCSPSEFIESILDRQINGLPKQTVSDDETRYPVDEGSMRAFLETFFTRHVFQLQKSLGEYIASPDFRKIARLGPVHMLDIGSGAAVASLAVMDVAQRTMCSADPSVWINRCSFRMAHVLNDTSSICLKTGVRMLGASRSLVNGDSLALHGDRVFTLSTPFPDSMPQINRAASCLGGYDLVVLSYVMNPLVDDYGLQNIVTAVKGLERLCRPHGRILIVQDKFREALVRRLADRLNIECREQTVAQEIYPPRGSNETYTYTYFDCFYAPQMRPTARRFTVV